MNSGINYIIEASIISMVCYVVFFLFLRKNASFNTNRWFLLGSIFASFVFPLFHISFTSSFVNGVETLPEQMLQGFAVSSLADTDGLNLITILLFLYGLGLLFFSCMLIFNLTKIGLIIYAGQKSSQDGITIIKTEQAIHTSSFLSFIIWNEQDNQTKYKDFIVKHERAHINQYHSLDRILAELYTSVFWFNPFAWKLKSSLIENHEFLADHSVAESEGRKRYTSFLACQTLEFSGLPISRFKSKELLRRISMLKGEQAGPAKPAVISILTFSLLFIVSAFSIKSYDGKKIDATLLEEKDAFIKDDKVYSIVEESASPEGGMREFYTTFKEKIQYPKEAIDNNIEGKVFIEFVIDQTGTITDIKTIKGIGSGCDKEAERILKSMPKWNPGLLRGNPVKQKLILPITFRMRPE